MSSIALSSLIVIKKIAAVKENSQGALMKQAQPRQSINIETSKKGLPTFIYCDTLDALSNGSTLPN